MDALECLKLSIEIDKWGENHGLSNHEVMEMLEAILIHYEIERKSEKVKEGKYE